MGLKGITKLELFDADTGILLDSIEESNMVTNAVSNIFNGALNALASFNNNKVGTHNYLDYLFKLPDGYNLAKALYGGVLIFSKNIVEDVEHCIPTIDEIKSCVGYANLGLTTGGSLFKGSFNESESEFTDNTFKFVWDFNSDQCNGDIACICLTSDAGANTGLKYNVIETYNDCHVLNFIQSGMWDKKVSVYYNSAHNPMFKSSFSNSSFSGMYVYNNYLYYVYRDKVYKYSLDRLLSKKGVLLNEAFNYGSVSTYDDLITLSSYETDKFLCTDGDKVFELDNDQSDVSTLTLYKVSGDAILETISIPTTNINNSIAEYFGDSSASQYVVSHYYDGVINNNKIYFLVGECNSKDLSTNPNRLRMYVLSFDGTYTYKDLNITNNLVSFLFGKDAVGGAGKTSLGVSFTKMFGSLVLISKNSYPGYAYYIVNDDGSIEDYPFMHNRYSMRSNNIDGAYLNTNWLKEPWFSFKFSGNGFYNSVDLFQAYLATINNLETKITKKSSNTLKITYTLTQV